MPDPGNEYNFWNWLGPFVAWMIGANGEITYVLFHAFFAVMFTALFMRLCFQRCSDRSARTAIVLFLALPVSGTVFFMVGLDAITVFLMLVTVAYRRFSIVTIILGALLGMQHFEQGLVAALSIVLFSSIQKRPLATGDVPVGFGLAWVAGLILGKIALYAIAFYSGISIAGGRVSWFTANTWALASYDFFHVHQILWCAFGPAWAAVFLYANNATRAIRPFVITVAFLFCFLFGTTDETRVFSMVSFPLLAICWLFNEEFKEKIPQRTVAKLLLLWMIVPWTWVWQGVPRWSAFPYDIAYVRYLATGRLMHVPDGYMMFAPITTPIAPVDEKMAPR